MKYLILTISLFLVNILFAQEQILYPPETDNLANMYFGSDVVVVDSTLFVSAIGWDGGSNFSDGKINIYNFDGTEWVFEESIAYPDTLFAYHRFGDVFDVDDDVLAANARNISSGDKIIVIFRKQNNLWSYSETIISPDDPNADKFAERLDVEGSLLTTHEDGGSTFGNRALVYDLSGASAELIGDIPAIDSVLQNNQDFAENSNIIDGSLYISSYNHFDNNSFTNPGVVYQMSFDSINWEVDQLIRPITDVNVLSSFSDFGREVKASAGHLLVSAPLAYHRDTQEDRGAVYAYKKQGNAWVDNGILLPSVPHRDDFFGSHLAIKDNIALIYSRWNSLTEDTERSVYVFELDDTQWIERGILQLSNNIELQDFFGFSFDRSGDHIFVAASENDDAGFNTGAVYVFNLNELVSSSEVSLPESKISIFPNPTQINSTTIIESNEIFDFYSIYSMDGKSIVNRQALDGDVIDLNGISPGTYLIEVTNKNRSLYQKLVLQ